MDKLQQLKALGIGEIAHLNGSLLDHLKGTQTLLQSWGANQTLCEAGLFHACYGTDGFDEAILQLEQRHKVVQVIGEPAESLLYLYGACDRGFLYPQFDGSDKCPQYRDRFTKKQFTLSEYQCRSLCELTAANELELCLASTDFKARYGKPLQKLFKAMQAFLSTASLKTIGELL
ncbi:DUF6817 domain-containing protein [uncultured Pseudoteredinibacter sp.]|uniref:DUF6817 domain-containing protein n=1 Tax=uncultured Pseudoteredinibacter sp. TaxID=1641701 RepID=UPI00260645C0|nr:hypothetical protein [uncultured Pseudoteredinibacter sp.]